MLDLIMGSLVFWRVPVLPVLGENGDFASKLAVFGRKLLPCCFDNPLSYGYVHDRLLLKSSRLQICPWDEEGLPLDDSA